MPDHITATLAAAETGAPPPSQDDELAALLCMALDSPDETRRNLMARMVLSMRDLDRETDLDRIRTTGNTTVVAL